MKPYQDLSRTGQFRRLAPVARRLLLDYDRRAEDRAGSACGEIGMIHRPLP